ncbi:MAG TPA: FHA domain-containing protein, partial [Candidatus Binataceae bacterium]|nr:FHA domain-containing protein [Candidatus Binataceae bacterium]
TPPSLKAPGAARAKARSQTKRSLGSSAKAIAQPPVSATAKTRDLGLKGSNSSGAIQKPAVRGIVKAVSPAASQDGRGSLANSATSKSIPASTEVDRVRLKPAAAVINGIAPAEFTEQAAAWLIVTGEDQLFGIVGNRTVIGRNPSGGATIDIDLAKLRRGAERVSQRHAEIIKQGADFFVRDLGSLNGTFIAGRGRLGRDQLYKLRDRDELVLGGTKLEFRKG